LKKCKRGKLPKRKLNIKIVFVKKLLLELLLNRSNFARLKLLELSSRD